MVLISGFVCCVQTKGYVLFMFKAQNRGGEEQRFRRWIFIRFWVFQISGRKLGINTTRATPEVVRS